MGRYTTEVSSRPQSGSARRKGDFEPRQEPPAVPVSQRPRPSKRPLGPLDRIPAQPHLSCLRPPHREEAPLPVDEDRGGSGSGSIRFLRGRSRHVESGY